MSCNSHIHWIISFFIIKLMIESTIISNSFNITIHSYRSISLLQWILHMKFIIWYVSNEELTINKHYNEVIIDLKWLHWIILRKILSKFTVNVSNSFKKWYYKFFYHSTINRYNVEYYIDNNKFQNSSILMNVIQINLNISNFFQMIKYELKKKFMKHIK